MVVFFSGLINLDISLKKLYYICMEFLEMETKEEIMALSEIERRVAPEVMGDAAQDYLSAIEHDVRMDSEAGAEYYLVFSGGPAGFFSLKNEGLTVTVEKIGVLPERRRQGIFRRSIDFIRATYDPTLLRISAHGADRPALAAYGFERVGDYYEKRYE